MKRFLMAAVAAPVLLCGSAAYAGPYSDDLGKCMVRSSTEEDRGALVRWLFSSLAVHPSVKDMATVTPQQREDADHRVADLFSRLLFTSCRKETVEAIKYEGPSAMQSAFEVFGRVSFQALASNKDVSDRMGSFTKFIDQGEMVRLAAEAGPSGAPAKP